MVGNDVKQAFTSQTNGKWSKFLEETRRYFPQAGPCSDVQLGFRFGGETGAMSYLRSEEDWEKVLHRLRAKIMAARSRLQSIEIKNVVSYVAYDEEEIEANLLTVAA